MVAAMSKPGLGRLLGSGKEAEIFECGSDVVKLYRSAEPKRAAFREAAILAMAESFGLPIPTVHGVRRIGDRWCIAMQRVDGPSFARVTLDQPHLIPAYLQEMARLQLWVHGQSGIQLAHLKARLAANIQRATMLREAHRSELLRRLAALPDGDRLCHGDFHPLNILGSPGHATILDWQAASCGEPAADVCRSYVLMRRIAPALALPYVDAYAAATGECREDILAWLPVVAAARLAEGVPEESDALVAMTDMA
jgi:aminoglycoside phosphotransferase (APT) family kinase protein